MAKLTIVANLLAYEDKVDLVKAELEKLVAITRQEAGCVQYDLHQDNADPSHFMFFEVWETRDLWQDHIKAPHIAAYRAATEGAVQQSNVHEMTHIA